MERSRLHQSDHHATIPAGAVGVGRFTTERITYVLGVGTVNFLNFGQTQGSNLAIDPSKASYLPLMLKIARDLSFQDPNFNGEVRRALVAGFYQHQWSPRLNSELAYQYAKYQRATNGTRSTTLQVDINSVLPRWRRQYFEPRKFLLSATIEL